jgi:hypothetical protein
LNEDIETDGGLRVVLVSLTPEAFVYVCPSSGPDFATSVSQSAYSNSKSLSHCANQATELASPCLHCDGKLDMGGRMNRAGARSDAVCGMCAQNEDILSLHSLARIEESS